MSQKQLAFPKTLAQSLRPVRVSQNQFAGMNEDDPASTIDAAKAVKLLNIISFGNYAEVRSGSSLISSLALPRFKEAPYDPYYFSATKTGTTVTLLNTGDGAKLTVGDYFAWTDGTFDQITAIDGDTFTSLYSETRAQDDTCTAVAQIFGAYYHDRAKKIYIQLGQKLYTTSTTNFTSYTEVPFIGGTSEQLGRSQSRFRPADEDIIIFNANKLYRIINNRPFNHYFPINASNPSRTFTEVEETALLPYGRQVTYSLSRIIGGNFNTDRLGAGNLLLQESAPVSIESETGRDTAKVFTNLPIGLGSEQTYELRSDESTPISDSSSVWEAYKNTYAFKVNFNGVISNIRPDFTDDANMFDVAESIQTALRTVYSKATCTYYVSDLGNPILKMTAGDTGTIEAVTGIETVSAPDAGNSLVAALHMDYEVVGGEPEALYAQQSKAPKTYDAIQVPTDGRAFTHATLWATPDIGDAGVAAGNKTEKLIWAKDVPLIRPFLVSITGEGAGIEGLMTGATFYQDDVGSAFRTAEGFEAEIGSLLAATGEEVSYASTSTRALSTLVPASNIGPIACVIGGNKVTKASQTNGVIIPDGNSDFEFSTDDIGSIVFVGNGGLRHIIDVYEDGESGVWYAEVLESASSYNFTDQAIGWDYAKKDIATQLTALDNRSIRDNITDKIIKQRGNNDNYILQTRYYQPLPSSAIGEMGNNFIFVAEDNSNVVLYGAVPLGKKHRLGYYNPAFQKDDNIEDVITHIKRYSDRIICFCRRSTYGSSLATINSLDEPDIGEKIFLVPSFTLRQNIGLVHVGSLQDIGIGQSIMITNEPGVRTFDGNQFGQANIASAAVMKYINLFSQTIYSSYDADGGYRLYGTLTETSTTANKINPQTGLCLQLAITQEQGIGWNIIGGPKMVMPMPFTEGLLIQDSKGYLIQAMLDELTGQWHCISTYDGPEGSDLEKTWTDKDNTEIIGQILVREDRSNPESEQLEFLAGQVYLRPDPSSVDSDDNPIYRTGQKVTARVYNDGRVVYTSQTIDIPIPGDITFDRKSEGPRIQLELIFATSQLQITGIDRIYASRDRAGNQSIASRSTTEMTYQKEYADQLLWITRGAQPLINRSVGTPLTGLPSALIAGPDGEANSAMLFPGDNTNYLEAQLYSPLSADFNVQFFLKFTASNSIPVVDTDEIPSGDYWSSMDRIGGDVTFIARNLAAGRFEFVINNVTRAYLRAAGWSNTEVSGSAATTMEVGFDQDRSCWLFFIDGTLRGVINGNAQTSNFVTTIPATKYANIASHIHLDDENGRIVFYSRTTNDTVIRATGYIDITGTHNGELA